MSSRMLTGGDSHTVDGITFVYGGGRLADIYMAGKCVDCMQACPYDWQAGKPQRTTFAAFARKCESWAREQGATYRAELPYLP